MDTSTDTTKGKVTDNHDGTFSYDPNGAFISLAAGQTATDKFLYTVTDAAGASSTATVTMTVTGQNDPPVASDVSAGVLEHGPAAKVTASFTDPDIGGTHTFSVDTSTDATKGKVTDNHDGTFSYDPNGAFISLAVGQIATDKFLYTVTDAAGAASTATVTIWISGKNDAPTISGGKTCNVEIEPNEDGRTAGSATGVIAFRDVDLTDTHTVSVRSHDPDGHHYFGVLQATMASDSTGGAA